MNQIDFLVLGGGSGGIASARRAAGHGARVVVVERGRLGGTCVNVGCVPKKIFFNASAIAEAIADAPSYGFSAKLEAFDWAHAKRGRDRYVERLNAIYRSNLEKAGVEIVQGTGRLVDANTLEVDGRHLTARHVLIATGGRPSVPSAPGAELGITSDGFFELESRPERVAIIGAGYVAVELAGIFRSLGSETTLAIRNDEYLRDFDAMLRQALMVEMTSQGIEIVTCEEVERIDRDDGTLAFTTKSQRRCSGFDTVVWAVGRDPNTEGLGLDAAGVETKDDGFIRVDDFQNTTRAGIYAVGDVTGRVELTPVAIAAGRRLADRLFGGEMDARLDYENVPSVVFSHPPIGTVGVSEERAREIYGSEAVKVYSHRFTNLYFALTERKPRTWVKLVVAGPNERVVGVHVIGMAADELIQGFAVAVKMGATKAQLDQTIGIHPTAAEELVTMRNPVA
jgi:glutathione reductase (NADPH)